VRFARFSAAHRRMCMCASAARDREFMGEYVTTCLVESDRARMCAFVQYEMRAYLFERVSVA